MAYHPRVPNLVFVTAIRWSITVLQTTSIHGPRLPNGSISQIDFHPTDNNINIHSRITTTGISTETRSFVRSIKGVTFTASATISGNAGSGGYFSVSPECDDCMYFASTNGVWISKDTAKTFTFFK